MTVPAETTVCYTVAEYLARENKALEKHEFRDGEIVMMAGGTANHSTILLNLYAELRNRLRGGHCRAFESNMRVRIPRKTIFTYPDASVVCGGIQLDPEDRSGGTLINPRVLIEVLSPSTEAYDRGGKFRRYQEIETLEEYVLISQSSARIETFLRQPGGAWLMRHFDGLDAFARLGSLNIDLPLAEVYAGVDFPPETLLDPNSASA